MQVKNKPVTMRRFKLDMKIRATGRFKVVSLPPNDAKVIMGEAEEFLARGLVFTSVCGDGSCIASDGSACFLSFGTVFKEL